MALWEQQTDLEFKELFVEASIIATLKCKHISWVEYTRRARDQTI